MEPSNSFDRYLERLSAALGSQPRWLIFLEAAAMTVTFGLLHSVAAWRLSMSLTYGIPIFYVVWYLGRRAALWMALLSAITWWCASLEGSPYKWPWGYMWAALNRSGYFVFVAVGGSALKTARDALKAQVEALQRARELEKDIVRVAENEQRRIGQDLHDGLCQSLAAIGMVVAKLRKQLVNKHLPEADIASEVEDLIEETVVEARDMARGILPVQMGEAGLRVALEELVARTRRMGRVQVSLVADEDLSLSDGFEAMHVYRIIQESVANAIKHSRAKNIHIKIITIPGLELTVEDDGVGLPTDLEKSTGMGMKTMAYRARMIGAEFSISNKSGGGVIMKCKREPGQSPPSDSP